MKIISLEYELDKKRYIFQFEDEGIQWFRFLDRQLVDHPEELMKWMNSLLEDAKVRE